MGGDGGSIPKRKERVKQASDPNSGRDPEWELVEKWKICPISGYPIRRPVMAGHYGHILSKEGVLEFLIKKGNDTMESYHIMEDTVPICDTLHKMRDVIELKLKDNPDISKDNPAENDWKKGPYVCPITGLETNGKYKFVFSWRCGCVISERALNECVDQEEGIIKKCLMCETPYNEWDLVVIHPKGKDFEKNQAKFLTRKMCSEMKKRGWISKPENIAGGVDGGSASSSQGSNRQSSPDKRSSMFSSRTDQRDRRAGPSTSSGHSASRPSGSESRSKRSHSVADAEQQPGSSSSKRTNK